MRPQNQQPCWLISNKQNAANPKAIKANKTIQSDRLVITGQDCKYYTFLILIYFILFFFKERKKSLFFLWVFAYNFKHHFILSLYLFYTMLSDEEI